MTAFVSADDVRGYMHTSSVTDNWSDANLGSNIRAASEFLQRQTARQFEVQTGQTKTFTSNGDATVPIPDLRTATSVTLQGAALTANASYWLLGRPGEATYTTVQLRAYGAGSAYSYLANPEWFDRNLDYYASRGIRVTSLPNDLVIVGDWGWTTYPDSLLHATKILAAFYAERRNSVLANVQVSPMGAVLDYSNLPDEVQTFIRQWRLGGQAALI